MKLCFGTFAKIINLSMEGVSQDKLVALLAKCVHKNSSYIANDCRYNEFFDGIKGDKAAISKVVNCKQDFYIPEDIEAPTLNKVVENLNQGVINLMGAKSKTKITLSLIRLIESDESIEVEEKDVFQSIFGLNKEQFVLKKDFIFSDFLAKTLLYVTDREIKNTKGIDSIKMISPQYVEYTLNAFANVCSWDSDNGTLTFYGYEILRCFNRIYNENHIDKFIEEINPTVSLDMDYWDDQIEHFRKDINNEILGVYTTTCAVIQKIIDFFKTLDEYFTYISKNVIPLVGKANLFVPINNGNVQLMLPFSDEVIKYREKLLKIIGTP